MLCFSGSAPTCKVVLGDCWSAPWLWGCGVPQGFIQSLVSFNIYMKPLEAVIQGLGVWCLSIPSESREAVKVLRQVSRCSGGQDEDQ